MILVVSLKIFVIGIASMNIEQLHLRPGPLTSHSNLWAVRACASFMTTLLVKEPGTQQETPWHQDQPYYNVDGDLNCSMWAPVDPVAPESTLEFNAGSHKKGWLIPRTFMDSQAKWFPEGAMSEIPKIEADRNAFQILGWELQTR